MTDDRALAVGTFFIVGIIAIILLLTVYHLDRIADALEILAGAK